MDWKSKHVRISSTFAKKIHKNLNSKSYFIFEVGIGQSNACKTLFENTNLRLVNVSKDLQKIGLIDKEGWEKLSEKNQQELPVYLANKMIEYIKENKKVKEMSKKWNVREGEIRKHITKMARYITEGIIDVIE